MPPIQHATDEQQKVPPQLNWQIADRLSLLIAQTTKRYLIREKTN